PATSCASSTRRGSRSPTTGCRSSRSRSWAAARTSSSARGGVAVRPDGAGGSAVETETGDAWTVTVENARPAQIVEWTIVETLGPDDATGIAAALTRWKDRGFDPRAFEIGTVFGTGGEVIDTREVRIAIDP